MKDEGRAEARTMMAQVDRDRIQQETHQALLGIPGTDSKGLVGDVLALSESLEKLNNRTRKSENNISRMKGTIIGLSFIATTALGMGIAYLLG